MSDKILFETPISAGFWLESIYFLKVLFEGEHEIIHIFSDEDFEYQVSSFFQEYFRDIEDSEIEFHRSVLIYSGHTRRRWCNI